MNNMLRFQFRLAATVSGSKGRVATLARRSLLSTATKSPVLLCILDGWGHNPSSKHNSVLLAETPNFDAIYGLSKQRNRLTYLNACEEHVGLPKGQIGNSEVGHMNIGAGRVVYQDICRIDNAINDGELVSTPRLKNFIEKMKLPNSNSAVKRRVHVMGLTSPGGVHSHQDHIVFMANHLRKQGVEVVVHVFTDGRDVPPQDAKDTLPKFLEALDKKIKIGSVSGRYYAMDRDKRWERVRLAYDAIIFGKDTSGKKAKNPIDALMEAYKTGKGDEFVKPRVIEGYDGFQDGDGVLLMNFRADRARQLLQILLEPEIANNAGFDFSKQPLIGDALGLVSYSKDLDQRMGVIMSEKELNNTLGEVVAKAGKTQLRIAETEKYPHVTFFFNGGEEAQFPDEERIVVPSPKVATYDLQPEMSAYEVGEKLCNAIESKRFDMIIANFANPDMVGHTGILEAGIKAVESVDKVLGNIRSSIDMTNGKMIVTADHGNCEEMWNFAINEPHTAHTLNLVPCMIYYGGKKDGDKVEPGEGVEVREDTAALCDLAPTILQLLDVPQPKEMTGKSLLRKK